MPFPGVSLQSPPSNPVITLTVCQPEGRDVTNDTEHRSGRCGVVDNHALDNRTIGHRRRPVAIWYKLGLNIFPTKATGPARTVRLDDGAFRVIAASLAWQSNTDKPLAGGKDDATIGVVPSITLVLAHDGKLDTVDGQQLVQGKTKRLGYKDVNFD